MDLMFANVSLSCKPKLSIFAPLVQFASLRPHFITLFTRSLSGIRNFAQTCAVFLVFVTVSFRKSF